MKVKIKTFFFILSYYICFTSSLYLFFSNLFINLQKDFFEILKTNEVISSKEIYDFVSSKIRDFKTKKPTASEKYPGSKKKTIFKTEKKRACD